jgi:NAD(P)H-hydrate epimerase
MRAFDAYAIERCHVPSLLLMENAGRGSVDVLARELLRGGAAGANVVIACGTGNNGGDGLVIARHLALRGAAPMVFLAGDAQRASPDARANLDAWRGLGGEIRQLGQLATGAPPSGLREAMARADVVVDALFGTGLDRAIDGFYAEVVRTLNVSRGPRFAVDLPSGLDADTGVALGVAVEAQVTVTFAHYKLGLLTPNGAQLAGSVHVVDIGVPATLVEHVGSSAQLIETSDVARMLPRRARGAHKTSSGHVVVIAGSSGKVGAPQLAARGAMRAGAGLATIVTWPDAVSAIESHILEAMTARIDSSRPTESIDAVLAGKHAVVVGPGFGLGSEARAVVEHVLSSFAGPIVVDADALTMFAGRCDTLTRAKKAILTPHAGELGRLLGKTPAQVEADRFAAAREGVALTKSVVVLKGAHTIVASPDGRFAVTPVACPALATAGSGDVLGGVVAAMACSLPPFEAACTAVMMHALAGEVWSRSRAGADRGLLASEIADLIPNVLPDSEKAHQ